MRIFTQFERKSWGLVSEKVYGGDRFKRRYVKDGNRFLKLRTRYATFTRILKHHHHQLLLYMTTENLRITTEGQRRPPSAFQEDPRIYFNQWLMSSQVLQTAFWTLLARLKCFSNTGFLNAFRDFIWDAGSVSQHLLAKLAWNANWQHSVKTSALLGDSLLDQKKKKQQQWVWRVGGRNGNKLLITPNLYNVAARPSPLRQTEIENSLK